MNVQVEQRVTDILENLIADKQAKELQKSIDFGIICDILVTMRGYVRVDIEHGYERAWTDVKQWCDENCSGEHSEHNGIWLFENEQDAIMFKLKWA